MFRVKVCEIEALFGSLAKILRFIEDKVVMAVPYTSLFSGVNLIQLGKSLPSA